MKNYNIFDEKHYTMIFGIVKEPFEKWMVFVHDVMILWYQTKSDFQELP